MCAIVAHVEMFSADKKQIKHPDLTEKAEIEAQYGFSGDSEAAVEEQVSDQNTHTRKSTD